MIARWFGYTIHWQNPRLRLILSWPFARVFPWKHWSACNAAATTSKKLHWTKYAEYQHAREHTHFNEKEINLKYKNYKRKMNSENVHLVINGDGSQILQWHRFAIHHSHSMCGAVDRHLYALVRSHDGGGADNGIGPHHDEWNISHFT